MAHKLNDANNSAPVRGHNSTVILDEDDVAALQLHYTLKIRAQRAKADQKKAEYDAERNELNGLFSLVKGDLKIPRKEFEELLALQDMGEAEFIAHEAKRHQRMANQGLPVGTQLDMFSAGDTVDDARLAYLDGLRAGRRGEPGVPPEKIATYLQPNWLEGWGDGQTENAPKLLRAEEIIAARSSTSAADADDSSDRDEEDDFDVDAEARRLKGEGFTDVDPEDEATPKVADVFPGADADAIDRRTAKREQRKRTHELAH